MAARTWNARFNWNTFLAAAKKEIAQPTRWPFFAASGIYLALIAKNHFGLTEEAKEHSLFANREGVKAHSRHVQEDYEKKLRLVQLMHARSQFEQTPAAPAAH